MDIPVKTTFKKIEDASAQELKMITRQLFQAAKSLDRYVLNLLLELKKHDFYTIDRYEHSLQTGTRAVLDNADDETIVIALLHDIGSAISPWSHDEIAASILRPFITENNYWLLKHHGIFQGYYYWDKLGLNNNAREKYREHPMFDRTILFCERWDNPSFDPDFKSLPLSFFEPLVKKLFSKLPNNWGQA